MMNAKTNTAAEDAQEVVLFDSVDVESNTSPDATDEVAIDATFSEADEEVLEDASPAKKHGFFSTKKAVFGTITLGIVVFTAVAVGAGVAGARAKNNKVEAQMFHLSGGKSGKSSKRGDIFRCVIEPALTIVTAGIDCVDPRMDDDVPRMDDMPRFDDDLPTTGTSSSADEEGYYTRDDFEKDVWKPYLKDCGEFWGDVFYLKLRLSELWCALFSLIGPVFCSIFGTLCGIIGGILSAIGRSGSWLFMTAPTFFGNCMAPSIVDTSCESVFSLEIGEFAANPEKFLNDVTTCAMTIFPAISGVMASSPPKFSTAVSVFDICSDEDVVLPEMGVTVKNDMMPGCMGGGPAPATLAVPTLAANIGAKLESMSPAEAAKARVEALQEIDVEAIAEKLKGEFPSVTIPKGVGKLVQAVQANLGN